MRFTRIRAAGAALLIGLSAACAAEVPPTPDIAIHREELAAAGATMATAGGRLEPPPLATAAPANTPTPSPAPPVAPTVGVGICYRTPEVQDWIIQQLQIPSCRLITEPELYRIKAGFSPPALKPGDMAGFANISGVSIPAVHCGDWANPDYARAMLAGLNPAANLHIEYPLAVEYAGEDAHLPGAAESYRLAMGNLIYPNTSHRGDGVPLYRNLDDLLQAPDYLRDNYQEGGFSRAELAKWPAQAQELKARINGLARDIAAAVQAAGLGAGKPIEQDPFYPGAATIGEPDKAGRVSVSVTLNRPNDVPACPAAED